MPDATPRPKGSAEPEADSVAPDPTHDLLLSNWTVVPHCGAIPTHYADGDRVLRVLSATER